MIYWIEIIFSPETLFTKRTDVLTQVLAKSGSREMRVKLFQSLPRCLWKFRVIESLEHLIPLLRDFTRFGSKTSYRLSSRGPGPPFFTALRARFISWGPHGAQLGPTGPRWSPCWPHVPCCLGEHGFIAYIAIYSGMIIGLRQANERRHYFVTTSLIGWVQA